MRTLAARVCAVLIICLAIAPARASVEDLVGELRRLVAPGANERGEVLGVLRALRDERLRPFFSELAIGEDPVGRVHGVLALAELSGDGATTPAMIARVPDPQEQALVIVETLRAGLLSDTQIREILAWPALEEGLEVLLRSHIRDIDDASMLSRLEALSQRETPSIGVVASLVLMDLGREIDPESLMARLREQGLGAGSSGVAYLLDFIRRERLTGAAPFVEKVLAMPDLTAASRADAIATLLVVAPEAGGVAWMREWGRAAGLVEQIRLALAGVSAWREAPERVLETIPASDNPVISAMGRVAASFRSGGDEAEAALGLWRTGYAPGIEWMVSSVEFLDPEPRNAVRRTLLETRVEGMSSEALVIRMLADGLGEDAPEELCNMARDGAVARDSRRCRVALAALIRAGRVGCASTLAEQNWPDPGTRLMAQVASALSGNTSVSPAQLERIALGVGSQSRAVRAAAAWEALVRMGEDRRALAMLLAER